MTNLVDRPIPPKPEYFGPDGAPVGVELRLDAFVRLNDGYQWKAARPQIVQRVGVVHTNAASYESTAASQEAWGRNTSTPQGRNTTKPHYIVDRHSARKVIPTNLRGIANSTEDWYQDAEDELDSSFWSYAIETADTGTIADPGVSDFVGDGAETVAQILAYESIVGDYEIEIPTKWNGSGVVTHTWPFPWPAFTTKQGKTCPGAKKKATFRDQIVPRARQIRAAWLTPFEHIDPTGEDMVPYFRIDGYADQFLAIPVSAETKRRIGDSPVVLVKATTSRADLEKAVGYKLTPMT